MKTETIFRELFKGVGNGKYRSPRRIYINDSHIIVVFPNCVRLLERHIDYYESDWGEVCIGTYNEIYDAHKECILDAYKIDPYCNGKILKQLELSSDCYDDLDDDEKAEFNSLSEEKRIDLYENAELSEITEKLSEKELLRRLAYIDSNYILSGEGFELIYNGI